MFFIYLVLLTSLLLISFFIIILALPTSTKGQQKIQSCKVLMLVNKVTKMHFFFVVFLSKQYFFSIRFFFSYILTSIFSQFSLRGNNLFCFCTLPPKEHVNFFSFVLFLYKSATVRRVVGVAFLQSRSDTGCVVFLVNHGHAFATTYQNVNLFFFCTFILLDSFGVTSHAPSDQLRRNGAVKPIGENTRQRRRETLKRQFQTYRRFLEREILRMSLHLPDLYTLFPRRKNKLPLVIGPSTHMCMYIINGSISSTKKFTK